jgi:hypothetical protein
MCNKRKCTNRISYSSIPIPSACKSLHVIAITSNSISDLLNKLIISIIYSQIPREKVSYMLRCLQSYLLFRIITKSIQLKTSQKSFILGSSTSSTRFGNSRKGTKRGGSFNMQHIVRGNIWENFSYATF